MKNKKIFIPISIMILSVIGIVLVLVLSNDRGTMKVPPDIENSSMRSRTKVELDGLENEEGNETSSTMKKRNNNTLNTRDNYKIQRNFSNNSKNILINILIVVFCLSFTISLFYLINSSLCKKNIKETFDSSEHIIIYILEVLIVTLILSLSTIYLNYKLFDNTPKLDMPFNNTKSKQ